VTFGHTNDEHPHALADSVNTHPILAAAAARAEELTEQALAPGSSSIERLTAAPRSTPAACCPTSTT